MFVENSVRFTFVHAPDLVVSEEKAAGRVYAFVRIYDAYKL